MDKYAKEFARALDASDISSAGLAQAIGVDPSYISQWKTGRRPIPADKARAVAAAISADPAFISKSYEAFALTLDAEPISHSQLVRLDPERIAELATVLAERWKNVPGGFDLRNEEHAAHFVLCYGLYMNMKEQPVPQNTVAFSAALTSPRGAIRDERGENVPAAGAAGRRAGKGGGR